jgi:hypothetical protein
MADRFSRIDAPRSAPEVGATPRQARWSWVIIAAIVVALGLAFYGISANQSGQQKVASQPAVTAAPAPAAGVAPPAPQTTTGQATPSAAPATTGRGGAGSPGSAEISALS